MADPGFTTNIAARFSCPTPPRVKAFPAKVYDLTAQEIQWEVEPGRKGEGVDLQPAGARPPDPGPRGRPGPDQSHEQAAGIHVDPLHGLELPNDQDGVPFITQPPVKPSESYTYGQAGARRRG